MNLKIPEEISHVTSSLENANFEAYLVGGCVRDLLRGKTPKDWDVTTNATPEEIQKIFGEEETFYENDFGTVGVKTESGNIATEIVEVTPYRTEGKYTDARRPDTVEFSDSLEEDLKRRDFTMNAIAFSVSRATLIDPYNGQKDIENKNIKAVGVAKERFAEDALRMMRAVRLAAELNFTIEAETMVAISQNAHLLDKISKERIRDELTRTIMSASPLQALAITQRLDLLKFIIPELELGIGCNQGGAHSFDVFEHSLRSVQHAADKGYQLQVRLAALLHDIGKPKSQRSTSVKGKYTFYGHEVIGTRMTKKIMKNLHFSKDIAEKVEKLVRWHMFFSDPDKVTLSAARRMVVRIGKEDIWDLLDLRICDRIGTGRPKEQPFRFRKYKSMIEESLLAPISVAQLKIDGTSVMDITNQKPGKRIGWILHTLFEEVLDDPAKNTKDGLELRVKELSKLPDEELKELGLSGEDRRDKESIKQVKKLRKKYHVN